jgi:hypothetical protein
LIRSLTKGLSGLFHQDLDYDRIRADIAVELVSIHIPKTAGQSFKATLQTVYGDDEVITIDRKLIRKKDAVMSRLAKGNPKVLHGHFTYSQISNVLGGVNVPVVAWLRDPVERVISNYFFFIKRIRSRFRLRSYRRQNEMLLEYASREGARNRMSKFLDGISLQDLFFVGFTESFADDLQTLGALLGWIDVTPLHLNANKTYKARFGPMPQETMTEIARLNERDVALYEKALSMRGFSRNHFAPEGKYG